MLKMYCIVNAEAVKAAGGNRGKMMAQAGHAFLHAYWDAAKYFPRAAQDYIESEKAYKITLIVPSAEELQKLWDIYWDVCGVSLVRDAGLTVFSEPTITCLGIGPIREEDIGEDLKTLKVFM